MRKYKKVQKAIECIAKITHRWLRRYYSGTRNFTDEDVLYFAVYVALWKVYGNRPPYKMAGATHSLMSILEASDDGILQRLIARGRIVGFVE